ncbi:MAG: hypothetical protein ACTSUE_01160 [Promethearchaeota archaeon]
MENILEFCLKRLEIYLDSGVFKRGLRSEQKGENWSKLYHQLKDAKELSSTLIEMNDVPPHSEILFLLGYYYYIKPKGLNESKNGWIRDDSFLGKEGNLGYLLGSFTKDNSIMQINILKNKGLVKKLLSFLKMKSIPEMERIFTLAFITLFRVMLKNQSSVKGYLIPQMVKIGNQLLTIDNINWNHVKTGFLIGVLSTSSIKFVLEKRQKREKNRDSTRKRRFLLTHTRTNNMCWELGYLFHIYSQEELNIFKSRKYARIAPNSRSLNATKIIRLFNYVGSIALRLFTKNAMLYDSKSRGEFVMSYDKKWEFMSLSEYILALDPGDIRSNQASMAFMIGYYEYWKKNIDKGENENDKTRKTA